MFDFHHFHSTSHEVLAVVAGSGDARARRAAGRGVRGDRRRRRRAAGGDRPPPRIADDGFTVVGAYPAGQEDYDLLREADEAAVARIAALGAPAGDPVGGDGVAGWRA